ncbi:MAG: ribosome biogenesis GTP-binding protein YihA/YsxC [Clostridia bacterium]
MRYDNATFETSFGTVSQLTDSDMPEIAFSGRSNVGKSSLLNKLLNRKALARVSSMPGKTVTINFFKLDECRFVDLPGYGYAKVAGKEKVRWSKLMEHYFNSHRDLRLVVQLIDMRHAPTKLDIQMLDFLSDCELPFIVALTKADKLNVSETKKQLELITGIIKEYGDIDVVPFSATKGTGVDEIKRLIEEALAE